MRAGRMLRCAQAVRMYSTLSADALASDEIWLAFLAVRLLDDAAEVLADAEVTTAGLASDAVWHNRGSGARSMSEALSALRDSVGAELAAVRNARIVVRSWVVA